MKNIYTRNQFFDNINENVLSNTIKQEITLEKYLNMGGDLAKVDWSKAYSDFYDKNQYKKIVSYEDKGEVSASGATLFHFTFTNGNTHRYAISWIKLPVELVLSENYI